MTQTTRRRLLATAGALGTAVLAGCTDGLAESQQEVSTVSPDGAERFEAINRNGRLEVQAWNRPRVELDVTKRRFPGSAPFEAVSVETTVSDGTLRIEPTYDTNPANAGLVVDLAVRVPSTLTAERVATANGEAVLRGSPGDPVVRSDNGRAVARNVRGYVTLETSNGAIESTGCDGIDGARTSNGSVDVEVLSLRQDADVRVSNGRVVIRASDDLDADVLLETNNGSIETTDVDLRNVSSSRNRVMGQLGEGGFRLHARSTNGTVELRGIEGSLGLG
jgi:DUF4097 and DUF4098 domain-containing protein YvlB